MPKHNNERFDESPSRLEASVLRQKEFYVAIGDSAGRIHDALNTLILEHEKIQAAVAKFAGTSDKAVDDYCINLFGQAGETTKELKESWQGYQPVLKSIQCMCNNYVVDINEVAEALRKRNTAFSERRHYEEKVHGLQSGERLDRNRDKLRQATDALTFSQVVSQQKVQEASRAHPKLLRLTGLRLTETLMRVLQQFGRATSSWDSGLKEGTEVQIIGKSSELHTVLNLGPSTALIEDKLLPSVLLTPTTWDVPIDTEASTAGIESIVCEDPKLEALRSSTFSRELVEIDDRKFAISPYKILRDQEEQLTITCPALNGPIAEVYIDDQQMKVVSETPGEVVVSGPLHQITKGKVEIMTEEAKRSYATGIVAIELYDLDRFWTSPVGSNVKISDDMITAERIGGSLNAQAFLSLTRSFFELKINEVQKKGAVRGPAFGFTSAKLSQDRLPNSAGELKCAFVVGGDLPYVYLDGEKLASKVTWRPRNDLNDGDIIQVLLAYDTFKVFQNGEEKVSVELPSAEWLREPLAGIVDIAGALKSVTIINGSDPLARLLGEEDSKSSNSSESEVEAAE